MKNIKQILVAWDEKCGGKNTIGELIALRDCLEAALEKERAGEVVLGKGEVMSEDTWEEVAENFEKMRGQARFPNIQRGDKVIW